MKDMKDKIYIPFTPDHPGWHDFTIQAAPYIHHYLDILELAKKDDDPVYQDRLDHELDETNHAIEWFASVFFNVPERDILSLDITACIKNYIDEYNSTRERSKRSK